MADKGLGNGEPLTQGDERLRAIRASLETTEKELTTMGYRIERVVLHPGSKSSGLSSRMETLILVLFGEVRVESQGETETLRAGSRLQVPSGVVYGMEVTSGSAAYWIQAERPEVGKVSEDSKGQPQG